MAMSRLLKPTIRVVLVRAFLWRNPSRKIVPGYVPSYTVWYTYGQGNYQQYTMNFRFVFLRFFRDFSLSYQV